MVQKAPVSCCLRNGCSGGCCATITMLGLNRFYSNNKGTAKKIIKVVTIVSCWRCNLRNSDASVFYVMTLAQLGKDTDLRSTLICEDSEERSGWAYKSVGQLHATCAYTWQNIIFFLVYYFFTILLRLFPFLFSFYFFPSFFFSFPFFTLSLHIKIYFNIQVSLHILLFTF